LGIGHRMAVALVYGECGVPVTFPSFDLLLCLLRHEVVVDDGVTVLRRVVDDDKFQLCGVVHVFVSPFFSSLVG